ncbi:HAD hydrolase-like protein [Rhodospirillum centenum]|uniref:Haloacid dehalogenase-like hydrolase, putative n=1 Tax=Rhodospirillum centenum (strain ATCC 51521 / SW) TaxID=414684 RepID=B6IX33_RHOCS|nr:HAD hydrolase-like protein [Rhodospirillum centenum]ACJ00857.1 haloacid dehalogenase-like hydrolase, putative [Rhodospirillum centenum SW]
MTVRLAIFDFDGTLADSYPWFAANFNSMAERWRVPRLSAEELEAMRDTGARTLIAHLGVPSWKLPLIAADMKRRMARDIGSLPLFDGVPALLAGLRAAGTTVAVLTSNSEPNVRRVMGPEVAENVDRFVCGTALFGKAPKLRRLLRDLRVPAAEALSIGDEIRDLDAAREAGVPFAGVAWGYTRPAALAAAGADPVFDTVAGMAAGLGVRL